MLTTQNEFGQPRQWLFVAWYGCLTFLVVFTLHFLMFHDGETDAGYQLAVNTHQHVITLTDVAPVQYRFVSYFLPELIHRISGFNILQSYSLFRWAWLWLACVVLHRYLATWFDSRTAFMGNLIVIATMPYLYLEVDLLNTDAPAYAFFVIAILLLRLEKSGWLLLTIPLSMLFRETGLLSIGLWAAVLPTMQKPKHETGKLLLATGLALLVYFGIRWFIGPRDNPWKFPLIWDNLVWPAAYFKLFMTLNLLWVLAALNLKQAPPFIRNAFLYIPAVIFVMWLYGIGTAARYYFPLFPLLLPLGLLVFSPFRTQNPPRLAT